MDEKETVALISVLDHVTCVTAQAGSDAPQVSWGDSFFYYEPDGPRDRRLPFATVVTKDYPGWDTLSHLDRPGAFRLNLDVGPDRFRELFGYPPSQHPQHAGDFDYSCFDLVLPHPAYAAQGWVSIVCPGSHTADIASTLIAEAYARAVQRWTRTHL